VCQFDIAMITESETHASDAPLDDRIDVEWQARKRALRQTTRHKPYSAARHSSWAAALKARA